MKKYLKIIIPLFFCIFAVIVILLIFINSNEKILSVDQILNQTEYKNEIEEIDFSNYPKKEITLENSFQITEQGVYELTGTIEDGFIKVDTKGYVKLILKDVNISNSSGPAILIENSQGTYIELDNDSVNILTDGNKYNVDDEDINGAIFSKDNLAFLGNGKLVVNASYEDGIVSKDNLLIYGGTIEIRAVDDGIRGRDSVVVKNGNIDIDCDGNGIKTTNSNNDKGYIVIEDGLLKINSILDGIQAETYLRINHGDLTINTKGVSQNNIKSSFDNGRSYSKSQLTESAKGLKAKTDLVIMDGTLDINSLDDAIHSNENIVINNGTINITSGDDGIHADTSIVINNGTIEILKSYEGIESANITINDGIITLNASDDGINVAGGNDGSSMHRPGENYYNSKVTQKLTIQGGIITVNASGDGLDANGSIYIKGGTIYVNGPTDNGNGALDYDQECVITGGTLIALGSSGMAQNVSSNSSQNTVMIYTTIKSDNQIIIKEEGKDELIEYKAIKDASSIVFSNPNLKKEINYELIIDNELISTFTFTDSEVITIGQGSSYGPNRMPTGPKKGPKNMSNI